MYRIEFTEEAVAQNPHLLMSELLKGRLSLAMLVQEGRVEEIMTLCSTEMSETLRDAHIDPHHQHFGGGDHFPNEFVDEEHPELVLCKRPLLSRTHVLPSGLTIPEELVVRGHPDAALRFCQDPKMSAQERLFLLSHQIPSQVWRQRVQCAGEGSTSAAESFDPRLCAVPKECGGSLAEWMSSCEELHGNGLFQQTLLNDCFSLMDLYVTTAEGVTALEMIFNEVFLYTVHPLVNVVLKNRPKVFVELCRHLHPQEPLAEALGRVLEFPLLGSGTRHLDGQRGSNTSPLLLHLLLDRPAFLATLLQEHSIPIPVELMDQEYLVGVKGDTDSSVILSFNTGWSDLLTHKFLDRTVPRPVWLTLVCGVLMNCVDHQTTPSLRTFLEQSRHPDQRGLQQLLPRIHARARLLKHPYVPGHLWDHVPTAVEEVCSREEEPGVAHTALTMAANLIRFFSVLVEVALWSDHEEEANGSSSSSHSMRQLYSLVVQDILSAEEIADAAHMLTSTALHVVQLIHDPTGVTWKKRSPQLFLCTQFLSQAHQHLSLDGDYQRVTLPLSSREALRTVMDVIKRTEEVCPMCYFRGTADGCQVSWDQELLGSAFASVEEKLFGEEQL